MTTTAETRPAQLLSSTARRWTILVVCASSLFLVGLDSTIVNVALPSMGAGLHTSPRTLAWVVDAYTIVLASLLITSGSFADRFGRRRVFRTGLLTFGLASVACAIAPTAWALVAARAGQGVGASMLTPVGLAIVVHAMPDPTERARAIGVWASVFGLSMAAGPVLGGLLVDGVGWRWVFWANVPLVALVLGLVAATVPESYGVRTRRLDPGGQLLLTATLALAVALLIEAPHRGWTDTPVRAGFAALLVTGTALVLVERRRREPLLDLSLFARPAFTAGVLGAAAVFVGLAATLLLSTYHLQVGRGWTPLESGLALLPLAAGATFSAPLSGIMVSRTGPRRPLLIAGTTLALGGVLLGLAGTPTAPLAILLVAYGALGVGIGFANAPITTTAVSGLPPERTGVAAGITSTARQVGSAMGIAAAGALVSGAAPDLSPGWLLPAGSGLVLLVVAVVTHRPGTLMAQRVG